MLESSSWSAASARPPRPRPVSAKPTRVHTARPEIISYSHNNMGDEEEEEFVEDDDGEDDDGEFGAAAEREHQLQQQVRVQSQYQRRHWSGKPPSSGAKFRSNTKFRPSSAPAGRPKSASTTRNAHDNDEKHRRSAASISIGYLRAASEKKKARDREFARELFREENEFKKKISVKIEQANKMMTAIGSSKSFGPAPDRDGIHMVKVLDAVAGDRVISVEIFHILSPPCPLCFQLRDIMLAVFYMLLMFPLTSLFLASLREFEQLASVPLGQTMQQFSSPSSNNTINKLSRSSSSRTKSSLTRGSIAPRVARLSVRPSSASREPQSDIDGTRLRAAKIKPADRSQVQEELRSVLEGTIELTKILQEQLHELRLKGWNVAPRS
ncbi:hypothetical protein F441_05791 [Phytophthora nicotianae CJ01A1]|uniref:Uncharacterized protein n=3 Tax=Phytophthora nicotianae TaxID=4792 RepID=W2XDQ2_PHYNI|nr:hypothetical protein F444_05834 [Phytophthora nicotianae P1976]ETP20513.1 hypothetical protein F441_05791 [Phytophthora nicotianae CJ01A1]